MLQSIGTIHFCFFFPYHVDSGVPVLFYRLAGAISIMYPEIRVSIIDYTDGIMARHTKDNKDVQLYVFEDDETITPPEDAILVMQSDVPYYWPKELKPAPSTKLFFWNLHPRNFAPSLLPLPFLREIPFNNFNVYKVLSLFYPGTMRKLKSFVKLLLSNHALVFMDKTNKDYTEKYLFIKAPASAYLPVPVSLQISEEPGYKNIDGKLHYNFCWIGRICDFKTPILIYTAQELANVAQRLQKKIIYHIIGDGPYMQFAKQNIKPTKWFEVIFTGALPHSTLKNYLLENADVVTSMGTSALEGAILKIPTLLLDFSYSTIKLRYRFRWLFNTIDFDLGHEISESDIDRADDSLKNMVADLLNNYKVIAQKTYNYYLQNHSLNSITPLFVSTAIQSTLQWKMIDEHYFEKTALLKLYNSIRGLKS